MDFPGHFQRIFQQLNQQRLHAQMCDCEVVVGGQRFQAHRSILAACSSHFKALLSSNDDAEGGEKGGSVMSLDPGVVTPEAFSTLLDMIYMSTLSLGSSNVMDVLLAASHLHLNSVVKACKLHLSRKNFPSSPPKGWRSGGEDVEDNEGGPEMEVSQSGGAEDEEVQWIGDGGETGRKRKQLERSSNRKRSCRSPGGWRCSPTVTGSTICIEEEEDETPCCLKTTIHISEVEGKYQVTKGESDEIQLPSSSSSGGICEMSGDTKVKIKEGDYEEEEEEVAGIKVLTVEVKKESPDPATDISPSSPLQDSSQLLAAHLSTDTLTSVDSLQSQMGSELPQGAGDAEDGDGLESLSELAFSSFLNPGNDCVMGGLGEEESLASLTAAATAAAAASEAPGEAQTDSSSLVLTPVPLQQLLPSQGSGFQGTLILQPAQNSLGFIGNLGVQVTRGKQGNSRGASGGSSGTLFRRIAPKTQSESEPTPESGAAGEPDPPFVRASEETVAKCKKAAAEDNVLLVEGEKKYACKICSKTFMNLTDCKKHIRVHTGEKPYPCPKCGKRFSQSSHLYKHSKNSTCLSWKFDQTFKDP
ncbi:zinc finger and BTB domain-containing protein 5-like [Synchiropus splendidus]|uniref:zinc finger and BTB domain-containing protein 5-like n=1 Tax=Synchiropus splendidus TaxID=270530 RepID=UPI00237D75D8|nr:zinc finger and BTB domain-containing protein 5-like [Synchiropus splendidus]